MTRHIPAPALRSPWDQWTQVAEAALATSGSWTGPHADVLAAAAGKLGIASARDRQKALLEGWDTPDGLLARWARLHRADVTLAGGLLVLKMRSGPTSTRRPPPVPAGPGLFD